MKYGLLESPESPPPASVLSFCDIWEFLFFFSFFKRTCFYSPFSLTSGLMEMHLQMPSDPARSAFLLQLTPIARWKMYVVGHFILVCFIITWSLDFLQLNLPSSVAIPCIDTEWTLYIKLLMRHWVTNWEYCAKSSCAKVALLLPCTNYHIVCCYMLLLANSANGILLFWLVTGTFSTPMWCHSHLRPPGLTERNINQRKKVPQFLIPSV